MNRMLAELNAIREVVTVYPRKARQKKEGRHTVLTRTSELQERLLSILDLKNRGQRHFRVRHMVL